MTIFGPKAWVNPFGKMSIFRLFEFFVFIAQKGVYSFQNIVKEIFLAYIAYKEKWEKWPFLNQNHGLILWEKMSIFRLFELFFYSLEKRFFVLKYRKRHFPGVFCLERKVGKMAIFGPKRCVNPFRRLSIFRLFELFVFIAWKGVFSFQNILKDIFLAFIA